MKIDPPARELLRTESTYFSTTYRYTLRAVQFIAFHRLSSKQFQWWNTFASWQWVPNRTRRTSRRKMHRFRYVTLKTNHGDRLYTQCFCHFAP